MPNCYKCLFSCGNFFIIYWSFILKSPARIMDLLMFMMLFKYFIVFSLVYLLYWLFVGFMYIPITSVYSNNGCPFIIMAIMLIYWSIIRHSKCYCTTMATFNLLCFFLLYRALNIWKSRSFFNFCGSLRIAINGFKVKIKSFLAIYLWLSSIPLPQFHWMTRYLLLFKFAPPFLL